MWLGSSNWTHLTRQHLEDGTWIDDPGFVELVTDYLSDLVLASATFQFGIRRPASREDFRTLDGAQTEAKNPV